MLTLSLESENDTQRLGEQLAEVFSPGTVVSLVGNLGAGKTRLVQAVTSTLGVDREEITSPTFVLVNEYTTGRMPVYHFDAYRLKDDDEFLELGPEEYFDGAGITFVEWGDKVANCLPKNVIRLEIEILEGERRRVTIANLDVVVAEKIAIN